MIFTLPKKMTDLRNEALVPPERPLFRLSLIKGGMQIFNMSGEAVAQVLCYKDYKAVSVSDGGGVLVCERNGSVEIYPVNNEGEELRVEKKRGFEQLVFFGNYKTAHYEIFIKKEGEVKPKSLVQAVAHPLNERLVNVKVADGENFLLAVALCLALPD